MQMLINSERVVMSGVAHVNIPAELFITGDDGTTLDLVWSDQYDGPSTGATEDLRHLWGHFPAKKPAAPSINEWVVRDLKTGGTLTARVYADHVSGNSIAVTFTVLVGMQEQ